MATKEMREVTIYSFSLKNLVKKSFSIKGFFSKIKGMVSNLGKITKKYIVKASALAIVYTDKLVKYIHFQVDKFELWLYKKLDAKFSKIIEAIPEEVIEVIEDIIE